MSQKRKYLEGISAGPEENWYPQPATRAEELTMKEVLLDGGSDVAKDNILTFRLKLGSSEFARWDLDFNSTRWSGNLMPPLSFSKSGFPRTPSS
jgi:hypothetical protein